MSVFNKFVFRSKKKHVYVPVGEEGPSVKIGVHIRGVKEKGKQRTISGKEEDG